MLGADRLQDDLFAVQVLVPLVVLVVLTLLTLLSSCWSSVLTVPIVAPPTLAPPPFFGAATPG